MGSPRSGLVPFLALAALASCAHAPPPAPAPRQAPTGPAARPAAERGAPRYDVRPIPVPPGFRDAVAAGTRTMAGTPGARYWQQRVSYEIEAELDPKGARLNGQETVSYVNNSPDTLSGLVLHLYQNLFKAGEARTDHAPITDGMVLEKVSVDGRTARSGHAAGPGSPSYQVQGTLMGLRLPRPLAPGGTARLDIAWHFTVPPAGAPRMGHVGSTLFLLAQWYPQVAVYDDVHGWDTSQYLGTGEFYLEYGDFDVSVTLPEGFLVAGTGELQNADEVLTPAVRQRVALAARVDTVVHVVGRDDMGAGSATTQAPGGELTWRFHAADVRDFAFAASNRYLWDATHVAEPDTLGGTTQVAVNAFYRPEATTWKKAALYTQHTIAYQAPRYGSYAYPQITSAEGPEGGMEYPMIVFVSAYDDAQMLDDVIIHEVDHQWYPMMAGSDEHDYAWQDEGLNTYIENVAMQHFYPADSAFADEMEGYLRIAGTETEKPMMREADLFGPYVAYGVGAYFKPGLALRALGTIITPDTLQAALWAYTRRWRFKHPQPLDFFNTVSALAHRDLSWFFYPWWYTTGTLDQAVTGLDQTAAAGGGETVTVTVEDLGDLPMPVLLGLTLQDGSMQRVKIPATKWLPDIRVLRETVHTTAPVMKVTIDPDGILPDVDRTNNAWPRPGPAGG